VPRSSLHEEKASLSPGDRDLCLIGLSAQQREVTVEVASKDGTTRRFTAVARLDTPVDIRYYANGGILQTVLRKMMKG
jgi:aconitase A